MDLTVRRNSAWATACRESGSEDCARAARLESASVSAAKSKRYREPARRWGTRPADASSRIQRAVTPKRRAAWSADSPDRRIRRESFVQGIVTRIPFVPFELAQARLFAVHFADLARRGQFMGDRDLQIAVKRR
jgi:hypothetical protein